MTAKFSKIVPVEYVDVSVSFDSDWSGTVIVQGADNADGDNYFTGTSGLFRVQKGATIDITVDSDLYQSSTLIPTAGIDVIRLYPGGTVHNTNYVSFVANEDTRVGIHCYFGYE